MTIAGLRKRRHYILQSGFQSFLYLEQRYTAQQNISTICPLSFRRCSTAGFRIRWVKLISTTGETTALDSRFRRNDGSQAGKPPELERYSARLLRYNGRCLSFNRQLVNKLRHYHITGAIEAPKPTGPIRQTQGGHRERDIAGLHEAVRR